MRLIALALIIFGSRLTAQAGDTPHRAEGKKSVSEVKVVSYHAALAAFEKIKEGMAQREVRARLGAPDHTKRGTPDENWYEEAWTYNLRKLAGYPKKDNLKATWEIHVMFVSGKVVHTRKIGWLE